MLRQGCPPGGPVFYYQKKSNNNNPHRKPQSNREREEKPVVVRLAEKFDSETGESVADEIKCREIADGELNFSDAPQNHKQQYAFQK